MARIARSVIGALCLKHPDHSVVVRHDMNRTITHTLPGERWDGGFVRGVGTERSHTEGTESKDGTFRMQARHPALVLVNRATRIACVLAIVSTFAVVVAAVVAVAGPDARAATDASASTDPTGAHVQLSHRGVWVEVRAPADGSGSGSGSAPTTGCVRRWVPTKYPHRLSPGRVVPDIHLTPMPPRPGPEYTAYHVYCGTTYLDSVWLAPSAFAPGAGALDVRAIAEQLARDLPYPPAAVHVSPDGRGLTGLESWFWVSGYSGPVDDVVSQFGLQVEVEAVPTAVQWDFGDGTPATSGSLGVAAPARSDVVHTYQRRSRGAPMSVRATVRLDVHYRVDGAGWQALDPVLRTATRAYPVVESRAALVVPR